MSLQPGVGLMPGIGVASVRYAPPPPEQARPQGVLSITQVGLDPAVARDASTDPVDALSRRLGGGARLSGGAVSPVRGLIYSSDPFRTTMGPRVASFGGVELPPVRAIWNTDSPFVLGEFGLDR